MDYKIQKDLHDRFRADTGLKLCIGNRLQYIEWLEQQAEKLFAIPVVVFSEARAEVCKRDECWKECVTWINDCRCIKSCDLHKQT